MTALGTHPVDDPDQLALIADEWTVTRETQARMFRHACWMDAKDHDGWVSPNRVRMWLLDVLEAGDHLVNKRQLSALWSTATARGGYLDNTDRWVRIEGEGSRGNGGKSVRLRRWRGWGQ